jgi:GNAT superfamily N-acetyltransferase
MSKTLALPDGSELVIRAATAADVPLIYSLIAQLAEFEKLSHEVVCTEERLRQTLFGPRPYAEVRIAERRGEAAGFALFFHNYSTFLARPGIYLEDLFVIPKFRSLGIGRLLLQHLQDLARERECGRLEWSVLDWNARAIQFYEGMGARKVAGWSVYRLTFPHP